MVATEQNGSKPRPTRTAKAVAPDVAEGAEALLEELDETEVQESSSLTREDLERDAEKARLYYEAAQERVLDFDTRVELPAPPGFWRALPGKGGLINVFAWLGIFFTVVFFPLGFIFSGLGIVNSRHSAEDKPGKFVAWVGFVLSSIAVAFLILHFFALLFALFTGSWGYMPYMGHNLPFAY